MRAGSTRGPWPPRSTARCEQQKPERVVVLAFPHHGGLSGVAMPDVDGSPRRWARCGSTREFAAGFPRGGRKSGSATTPSRFSCRSCKGGVPDARVTPLYVGPHGCRRARAAAERLAAAWRPGVVFVASSDFTHYGRGFGYVPFPPEDAAGGRLRELDGECIEAAGSLDSALFLKELGERRATVCGSGPIALLLETMRRLDGDGLYQSKLDYQTSGEITGDYRHSVSYAALGYYPRAAFDLDAADREALLDSAAETLGRLRKRANGRRCRRGADRRRYGAPRRFVSLRQGDELLGCVGNTSGRGPLAEDAADLALSAALEDPRFRPAAKTEGPIEIEISVLTPLRRIADRRSFARAGTARFSSWAAMRDCCCRRWPASMDGTAEEFLRPGAQEPVGTGGARKPARPAAPLRSPDLRASGVNQGANLRVASRQFSVAAFVGELEWPDISASRGQCVKVDRRAEARLWVPIATKDTRRRLGRAGKSAKRSIRECSPPNVELQRHNYAFLR